MYLWNWEPNEAKQESNALLKANRCDEDAMQAPIAALQNFDESLSLGDVFILHALGVKVLVYQDMLTL